MSTGVVTTGVAVSSPALYAWLVADTMSAEVALIRCAIAVVVCWVALSVMVDLAFSPAVPVPVEEHPEGTPTAGLHTKRGG